MNSSLSSMQKLCATAGMMVALILAVFGEHGSLVIAALICVLVGAVTYRMESAPAPEKTKQQELDL